ncbi:hypothetical protein [Xylophilus sp. Leaf220]|uniref:hypothetical protein n=1 Tax=Xylophilus sp. Leaf220 TaxID=1735686 RepID=UPI00070037D5|nr:hypothetical protein [Xylophilus sp. Leaf220]KQM75661.1 hypothetical protein ASE76_07025 [Xylophilus sp. Leaf220]
MDFLLLATMVAIGAYGLKARDQGRRIILLGTHLRQYQIEKLMENLTEGYLRALGEDDPERRQQIWNLLHATEGSLANQFQTFATEFARVDESQTRVSTLPVALPYAARLLPAASFDVRKAFSVHARGIADAARNTEQRSTRDRAFTMSAELFLMQHTCHWFCRSKAVASARMMARHQTTHQQLVDAVAPDTRRAYLALIEGAKPR